MSVVAEHAPAGVAAARRADRLLADRPALTATVRAYGDALGAPTLAVAAALALKAYSYSVIEPVVTAWTTRRRVPNLAATNTVIRPTVGGYQVRPAVAQLTVLPDDPLAGRPGVAGNARAGRPGVAGNARAGRPGAAGNARAAMPGVAVVADETVLLHALRTTLIEGHLAIAVEAFRAVRGGGARPLWGSVAQSLCYPVTIAAVPDRMRDVTALLGVLGSEIAALVEPAELIEDGVARPVLLRRTCCYAYALPSGDLCSSCCLLTDDQRERVFAERGATLRRRPVVLGVPAAGRSRAR